MIYIEVYEQGKLPRQYPLTAQPFVIGRSDACDHTVKDPYISSRNTQVSLQIVVADLGSRNGTWLGEEQIQEKVVPFGDLVKLGRDQNVAFRIAFTENGTQPKTDPGERTPSDKERLATLQEELAERNRELSDARRELSEAREMVAGASAKELEVQELRQAVEARTREADDLRQQLAEQASAAPASADHGSADQTAPASELQTSATNEFESLHERIRELEHELSRAREGSGGVAVDPAPAPARAVPSVVPSVGATDSVLEALQAFLDGGADLEPALVETVRAREDLAPNLGFALGRLYRFGRDIEKVVTRIAQEYRGSQLDQTMLPGIGGNLSRSVNGLLLRGGEERRRELDLYLQKTRVWWISCLTAPRQAVGEWYKEVLLRIHPSHIERETAVSGLKKAAGLDAAAYWKRYRELMADLTHDIAMDEIDGLTAELAVKMAEKEGVVW